VPISITRPTPHSQITQALRSRLHFCHAQEGRPRSPQGHVGGIGRGRKRIEIFVTVRNLSVGRLYYFIILQLFYFGCRVTVCTQTVHNSYALREHVTTWIVFSVTFGTLFVLCRTQDKYSGCQLHIRYPPVELLYAQRMPVSSCCKAKIIWIWIQRWIVFSYCHLLSLSLAVCFFIINNLII